MTTLARKTLSAILALAILLSLAACGGEAAAPEEAGSYVLFEMTFEGEVFDNDFLETSGFELYTMELSADGSGWLKIDGKSGITWGDGKITVLYLSTGLASEVVGVKDGQQVLKTTITEDLAMHPSGTWGLSFWLTKDTQKVTKTEADSYLAAGSVEITNRQDQFTHTTESRRKIEKDSGGGGTTVDSDGFSSKSGKF